MTWRYYRPTFEYQATLWESLDAFGWVGHVNFAYDLVSNAKPKVIVELGTHWGVSFFAFCQAVKDHNLPSQLNAVDTWQGEEHAGVYGEEVIKKVKEISSKFFPSLDIKLHRSTFDDALASFADHSIDLLHIDGLHTYQAVKHDFESWLPKLKNNGIILLHDTSERGRGFGVWQLWEELVEKYSGTFLMAHSHGLGFICRNKKLWQAIEPLQTSFQLYYGLLYERNLAAKSFAMELAAISAQLSATESNLVAATKDIAALNQENKRLTTGLGATLRHAENLQAILDDIQNSKLYKLKQRLSAWRRVVRGK